MVAFLCLYVLLGMWAIAESFPHFIRIISDG